MKAIVFGLTSLLLLSAHSAAQSVDNPNAGRWYQVEIIIFSQPSPPGDNEIWPDFPILNYMQESVRLTQPEFMPAQATASNNNIAPAVPLRWPEVDLTTGQEKPFVQVPEILLQLSDAARAIDGRAGRKVLSHTAWNMPVWGEEERTVIRLQGGEQFGNHHELDGFLAVHVGRFLHIETDLYHSHYVLTTEPLGQFFRQTTPTITPSTSDGLSWNGFSDMDSASAQDEEAGRIFPLRQREYYVPSKSVHLAERRRMSSGEIHYLDSPNLGMVIQFTPYVPAEVSTSNMGS
ncbi:MAG: hypothetical protein JXQ97_01760 [Natronospirillum sp.]